MSTTPQQAFTIVDMMMENDRFSQWLGIQVVEVLPGFCHLQMMVSEDMCNGFAIGHGGIAFSLADSCCSFSANAHGRKSVSVETAINQFKAVSPGETLTCISNEESLGKKLAVYSAVITNHDGARIALFKGTYYRSEKRWIEPEDAAGNAHPS